LNTAVILAAGLGSRLSKALIKRPKGFIEFDGQALVIKSINNLKSTGIKRIIIGTGYLSEYYEALEDNQTIFCVKNPLYATTGSFFTLCNLENHIHEDFILLESDLLYEKRALSVLMDHNKNNVILASENTGSGDEVFIEVDNDYNLSKLSKNQSDLLDVYGELVGISKISFDTYQTLSEWSKKNIKHAQKIHYEEALVKINDKQDIYVEKIKDLIWTEIDTEKHYRRSLDYIYPELLKKENA
jgi:2-aminoethylphosphonate-pyruvate transaminase